MNDTTNPNVDQTEETEYDNPGIEGQLLYPDPEVDAAHAARFAAGKEDTLYPEGDPRNEGWVNPADRPNDVVETEEQRREREEAEQ